MMAQIGPLCLPLCSALKQFPALEVNDGVCHNTNITFLMNSYRLLVLVLFRFTVLFFCMCIVQDTGTGLNLNHLHHDINNRLKWHWKSFLCAAGWLVKWLPGKADVILVLSSYPLCLSSSCLPTSPIYTLLPPPSTMLYLQAATNGSCQSLSCYI